MSELSAEQRELAVKHGIALGDAFIRYNKACWTASLHGATPDLATPDQKAEVEEAALNLYRTWVSTPIDPDLDFSPPTL